MATRRAKRRAKAGGRGPRAASRAGRARGGAEAGAGALGAALRELADRRAIEDALIAYAHALDARDYARLAACFADRVRVKYGAAAWLTGVEAAARFCARVLEPLDASQHRLGTADVRVDGDRATSKTYLCAEHVRGGARFTVGGHYVDAWRRTPAGWRITRRELVTTWTDGDPAVLRPPDA